MILWISLPTLPSVLEHPRVLLLLHRVLSPFMAQIAASESIILNRISSFFLIPFLKKLLFTTLAKIYTSMLILMPQLFLSQKSPQTDSHFESFCLITCLSTLLACNFHENFSFNVNSTQ